MTRHAVAVLTAMALAATAAPAFAHDGGLPQMPPLPHQTVGPDFEDNSNPKELDREDWLGDCRSEYSGEYGREGDFDDCEPHPVSYGMGYRHGGPGPAYHYRHGYPGYAVPVMWVPVKIKTRYVYSEPLRREKEVVVEKWVDDEVVDSKTLSRPRKASKAVPVGEGKPTRSK